MKPSLIVIVGPTAVGKTNLSIEIAKLLDTCIISADSRQFYKEMKIGTSSPAKEQLARVRHYFIGSKTIEDLYNVSLFENETLNLLGELFQTRKCILLVGGSGLYIEAVCKGIDSLPDIDSQLREELVVKYKTEGIESLRFLLKKLDPEYYGEVDLKNHMRILKALEICLTTGQKYSSLRKNTAKQRDFNIIKIGLNCPREELHRRIGIRVDRMIEDGLIEEARHLYPFKWKNVLNSLGYKELFDYFSGEYEISHAIELIKRNTRRYARKQISWFGRDKEIKWFSPSQKDEIIDFIRKSLHENE